MVIEMNPQRFYFDCFSISSSAKILRFEEGEVIIDYKMLKATNVPKFGHQQQRTSILRFLYLDMQFSIEANKCGRDPHSSVTIMRLFVLARFRFW